MAGFLKDAVDLVDTLGIKDLVQLGVSLTQQSIEEKRALVEVSEVYSSDYRLKLDDAKRWLEEDGLKVEAVVAMPNIAFKDCSESEVVATNYKLKQKVKPGTRVILRYVTLDVIEKSKQLFDESERQKAEVEQEKAEIKAEKEKKRLIQNEKNKQAIDDTLVNVKRGLIGAVANTKKRVDQIIPTREKSED